MTIQWTDTPESTLRAGDVEIEYACWGASPDTAPTLVLLHEGLGSVGQWKGFPRALAETTGFGVFAYSRAGYGGSDPVSLPRPLDYMTREAIENLGPVLDAAGIQQTILLGHSDGATIAAIYAGSVADMRVRGLILIAPHFFTEPGGLAAIKEAGEAYSDGDLKPRLEKYHNHVDVAFYGWHDVWTDPAFTSWNVADAIDHWRIPVLAIQGRDDAYGTLAQISEIEARIYSPVETLILPDCGHAPHLEREAETLAGVTEFCTRLRRLEQEVVSLD
ncbi:Hydrolase [Sulfitobacter noctilucicola]|uniref:Pimeloyl-ACP methyl ester carboxylesterase n=1 Tax=Sulfitobacter noctilucicola TaxID=1342301 RepID=A0A7W6Q2H5_9RHOB|nr:alpha/beta hydrolase [Sulfitobacter noctilucicola]KIN62376.1 Hydrolase [Sulfitobacter noctilucicola]MBB4173090.1 pimeloyl-ACP methyl ester carboxylesterase [Sulfitobacter noctilucicola]